MVDKPKNQNTMNKKLQIILTLILTLSVQISFAQDKVIKGTITDKSGEPLPGANIKVQGSNTGAASDFDGNYIIKAKTGDVLVFTYIGYKTVTKKVGTSGTINVTLQEGGEVLKTVTINALGVEVRKASQKGIAVSKVKAKVLQTTGEHDPVAALSGKVAGVNINLASGDPGASSNILIRGPKSVLLSTKPLFVIDGVPVIDDIYGSGVDGVERPSKISDIDPNNIASIKVLKGGTAAALWGSKGANGVILITTKKGKYSQKGSIDISINSSFAFDSPLTKFPLQEKFGQGNNGQYVTNFMSQSGSWGDKISSRSGGNDDIDDSVYFLDQDGKKWYYIINKNSTETFNEKNYNAAIGKGTTLRNGVQLSTATQKAKYYLSLNHLSQTGIFKNSFYDKVGISFNSIVKPTEKLKVSTNIQYTNSTQDAIQKGSNLSGLLLGLYRTPADFDNSGYTGIRNLGGTITLKSHRSYRAPLGTDYKGDPGYNNPLFTINQIKNPFASDHIIGGTNFTYDMNDWLRLIAKGGVDYASEKSSHLFPINSGDHKKGEYNTYLYSYIQYNGDLIAQINKTITESFNLDFLIGVNWNHFKSEYVSAAYSDFLIDSDIPTAANASSENKNPGLGTSYKRKNSGYASATFSYKNLLYTTVTGRGERASTFGGFIFYPSVSLAFDFANLKFLEDNNIVNQATLRGSWSKVGNEPGAYLLDTYYDAAGDGDGYGSYWSGQNYGGAIWRSSIKGNPNIKPETTTEMEFGLDLRMFDRRLKLMANYYDSKSEDLLLYVKQPASTGFSYKWDNIADMTNKGYELELGYDIIRKDNFNWNIGGSYSKNINKVTNLAGSEYIGLDGFSSTSSGVAKNYAYGILRSGDWKKDANGKLILDANGFPQKGELSFAGDPNPDFRASVHTDLRYKAFKLRILIDGTFGGQSWDGTYGALTSFGRTMKTANEITVSAANAAQIKNSAGFTINQLSYAHQNADGSYTVRGNLRNFGAGDVLLDETWYSAGNLGGGFGPVGTQFFRDATWAKLREVTLGYTFRGELLRSTKIKSIDFGITGRNLFLWTKDKNWHIDPESNLSGSSKGRGLQYFNHPTTNSIIFSTKINF